MAGCFPYRCSHSPKSIYGISFVLYLQTNPFADDEAAEDADGDDDDNVSDDDDEMNLKLDLSEEESGTVLSHKIIISWAL